jgi:coenzyme PQQ synthesis protein D (PqqD)
MTSPDTPPLDRLRAPVRLRTDALHWRIVDGEVLMLDSESGRYLALNRSGAALWEMLLAGTTRAQLTERLVSEYAIGPAQAAGDIEALLDDLSVRRLLVSEGG